MPSSRRSLLVISAWGVLAGAVLALVIPAGDDDAGGPTSTVASAAPLTSLTPPTLAAGASATTGSLPTSSAAPSSTSSTTSTTSTTTTVFSFAPPSATVVVAPTVAPPAVDAAAYVVFDMSAGAQLASFNADTPRAVGSLMKMLTAYVVTEAGEPDRVVTVPQLQLDQTESQIGLFAGEQLSRAVLMRAMMIVSANDAATTLAIDVGGDVPGFVTMMNAAASGLGMSSTVAVNATGLDASGQQSTANDMLVLARVLMTDPTFRETVARRDARLHGQVHEATNDLLRLYPGADGIKTGHTTDAGYCLAASATRNGRTVIVVVLGSSTDVARQQASIALLDWAFTQQP